MKQTKGRQTRDGATVRRVQVMLDDVTIERARVLGDGNLSQGIRASLKGSEIEAICQMSEATPGRQRGMIAAQTKEGEMSTITTLQFNRIFSAGTNQCLPGPRFSGWADADSALATPEECGCLDAPPFIPSGATVRNIGPFRWIAGNYILRTEA